MPMSDINRGVVLGMYAYGLMGMPLPLEAGVHTALHCGALLLLMVMKMET